MSTVGRGEGSVHLAPDQPFAPGYDQGAGVATQP
jgi:hypothetical protein